MEASFFQKPCYYPTNLGGVITTQKSVIIIVTCVWI